MSDSDQPSLAFGGQALIEGVMMRSSTHMVICVRQPDQKISINVSEINPVKNKRLSSILTLPFIRGIFLFFENIFFGVKSLLKSANIALEEEEETFTGFDYFILIAMVIIINALFISIPFLLTTYLGLTGIIFNVVESGLRLGIFLLYLYLISRWGEVSRVLQYHGAEHKAINAFEAKDRLEIESVSKYSRLNPRCGTSFLFFTIIISIALFALIPRTSLILRLLYRLSLLPLIASLSYEVLRLNNKYRDNPLIKTLIMPGLQFQHFTTKEPDSSMIEVAIKALQELVNINSQNY
jgi:uncharacterized protein YqhQ